MFCTQCGAKLDADAKFCSYCGTAIVMKKTEKAETIQSVSVQDSDETIHSATSSVSQNLAKQIESGAQSSAIVSPKLKGIDGWLILPAIWFVLGCQEGLRLSPFQGNKMSLFQG